MIVKMLRS